MHSIADRRLHERLAFTRPCKLFHWETQRYVAARACDLSAGGALIRLETARPIAPDDRVDLFIAWDDRGIVPANQQVRATVRRTMHTGEHSQIIALEFDAVEAAFAAAA